MQTGMRKLGWVITWVLVVLGMAAALLFGWHRYSQRAAAAPSASAALGRKPSFYDQSEADARMKDDPTRPDFLSRIGDPKQFDSVARVYNAGTEFELPHALFLIERGSDRVFYINSLRYPLHEQFIQRSDLFTDIQTKDLKENYRHPDRAFLFGTVSRSHDSSGYVYEFWEGDRLDVGLLRETRDALARSFFAPLRFKANSTAHEQVAAQLGLDFLSQAELIGQQAYLPLNQAEGVGQLRIIESADALDRVRPTDIVVLGEVPLALPPVAGVITAQPSTLLSHVNVLAKGWGIPDMYLRDATQRLRAHDGQWIKLKVGAQTYSIDVIAAPAARQVAPSRDLPRPDLADTRLRALAGLGAKDQSICGAKSSNLGRVINGAGKDVTVPDGFCIPFAQYAAFMREHGLAGEVAKMQARPGFADDAAVRKQALAELRARILSWQVAHATSAQWTQQWQQQLRGQGAFVRSSSNSEDLPDFSGAGLYSTVPNVRTAAQLEQAVKEVWASVFNFEAYEARRAFGFPADAVYMSVLVQTAVDADRAGVLITRDPYDGKRKGSTYISAKRGLGIRVVEGQRIAEQVIYYRRSDAIQMISRSADDTRLVLDPGGGVSERKVEGERRVLDDALVRRLAAMGETVKQVFDGQDQDIEWAVSGERILLLQARPYR